MKFKSKIKKILTICFTICIMFSCVNIKIKAAIFGVSATNNGNGTTTVTITGDCVGGFTVTAGGASASVGKTTISASATVTLNTGAGTFNVTVVGTSVSDDNYQLQPDGTSVSTTVTVTVPTPPPAGNGGTTPPPANNNTNNDSGNATTPNTDEKDSNTEDKDATNKLASLEVSVGELSPTFDAQTIVYDVNAPADTSKITIHATPANEKATIEGIGEKDVHTGDNVFEIICRAENGSTTTYTIRVHVSEKAITTISYGNKKLGVLNSGAAISNLFEEKKITVNGKEVSAWVNTKLNITLLYMQNEKTGDKDYYMYDTKSKKITSIYRPFAYEGKNLVMIDVPKKLQTRKGMKFTNITVGEYTLPGWEFDDASFKNYAILYVMDEAGNIVYYQYERKENSLQLFSQAAAISQSAYEKGDVSYGNDRMYWIIIGVLGVLSIILLSTTMVFFRKRNKMKYRKIDVQENRLSAEAKSLLHKVDN